MDVKQIEYIVKIADERSITHAAEKLYLTQSALNQQLLRLEKELGAPIFYRTKSDWRPTPIGEVYLEAARDILRIKKRAYNLISDMTNTKKGRLAIGFTPGRGIEMFTQVYPLFHQAYPDTVVEPHELSVHQQQGRITQGDLDIGFQTLSTRQRIRNEYITLGKEELVIAIPSVHPLSAEAAPEGEAPAVLDLSRLRYEPFVLMYKESTTRSIIDEIFRSYGFAPNVLFETSNNQTIISMIQARLCCGIVPWHYVKNHPEGVTCFALAAHPNWDIVASYQKNSYLSSPARHFIRLAKEFWLGK